MIVELTYLVRVEVKESTNANNEELNNAAYEGNVVKFRISLPCGQDLFFIECQIPVFHHVRRLSFQVISETIHAICIEGFAIRNFVRELQVL